MYKKSLQKVKDVLFEAFFYEKNDFLSTDKYKRTMAVMHLTDKF